MPTYEYACTACGERTEARQSFSDPPLEVCPNCDGKLRKLYSPVGVVFKGSGFYSTDAKKKASSSSDDSKSASADSNSSTGDSKASSGDTAKGADSEAKPSSASGERSA